MENKTITKKLNVEIEITAHESNIDELLNLYLCVLQEYAMVLSSDNSKKCVILPRVNLKGEKRNEIKKQYRSKLQ